MSDTPRTDVETCHGNGIRNFSGVFTPAEFSKELERELTAANQRIAHLQKSCAAQNEEICQIAGKVLGYPWFKDDPKNFPDADESCGVCVGEHVAETIVEELARKYREAKEMIERLENQLIRFAKEIAESKP